MMEASRGLKPKNDASKSGTPSRIGGAAHVVGVGEILGRRAGGEQLGVRQVANGFDAVAQIPPELGRVARSGKTARHADDRDGRGLHGAVASRWRAILRRAARSESWLAAACAALRIARRDARPVR